MNLALQFIYLATKWCGVKVVNKQNMSLLHTVYSSIIALKRAPKTQIFVLLAMLIFTPVILTISCEGSSSICKLT